VAIVTNHVQPALGGGTAAPQTIKPPKRSAKPKATAQMRKRKRDASDDSGSDVEYVGETKGSSTTQPSKRGRRDVSSDANSRDGDDTSSESEEEPAGPVRKSTRAKRTTARADEKSISDALLT
jgi:hypothetical protein